VTFGFFNFNPNFSHQLRIINCQRFDYSAVVFFRAHQRIGVKETKNHEYQPTERIPERVLVNKQE